MSVTALTQDQLADQVPRLDGWSLERGALIRSLVFEDFSAALAFMVRVGVIAEKHGHHPEWTNVYHRVAIRLSTHDAGGAVTQKDLDLAAAIDRVVATS